MRPDLAAIIGALADRADDFLATAKDRAQGRAAIEEEITLEYPGLASADRAEIVHGVMAVLEDEDFFGTEFVGDPFADEAEDPES